MGRFKKMTCEEVLEECERTLHRNRCPLKELRREMRQAKNYLGTVDWEELEDA